MQSYLSNRKQRTKINLEFSSWKEILYGVSQGSILGPHLFNIFLCDLFFIMNEVDFASYADDNTPFFVGNDLDEVIFKLQSVSKTLFQWFADNQIKANPSKCHFICSPNLKTSIMIENRQIHNSTCEKLLGVFFDNTPFPNLFPVSTCNMKTRAYLVNCKQTDFFTNVIFMKKLKNIVKLSL